MRRQIMGRQDFDVTEEVQRPRSRAYQVRRDRHARRPVMGDRPLGLSMLKIHTVLLLPDTEALQLLDTQDPVFGFTNGRRRFLKTR
jgi:hypothetical protein